MTPYRGDEETQRLHLNPRSGRWLPDHSHLQRHVGSAIAWNLWQYGLATGDTSSCRGPRAVGRPVGLCGQRSSDAPAFAAFLVGIEIDSVSVAPDSFPAGKQHVAAGEERRYGGDRMVPAGIRPAHAEPPSA